MRVAEISVPARSASDGRSCFDELELTCILSCDYQFGMRRYQFLILMFLLTSPIGCASIGVRTGGYSKRAAIYPATAVDVGIMSYVAAKPFTALSDHPPELDAQEGLIYLFLPVSIVDLPLAVALDTVLLPYDIHKSRTKKAEPDSSSE